MQEGFTVKNSAGHLNVKKMKLLVTMPDGYNKEKFFDEETKNVLEKNFDVEYNPLNRNYTCNEIKEALAGKDIVMTGWGILTLIGGALTWNDTLKLIEHTSGSGCGDL